jgi:hypothetical protein
MELQEHRVPLELRVQLEQQVPQVLLALPALDQEELLDSVKVK